MIYVNVAARNVRKLTCTAWGNKISGPAAVVIRDPEIARGGSVGADFALGLDGNHC